jgi:hypothetical protein
MVFYDFLQRGNFRCTDNTVGVEAQLNNLALITQVIDPKLHQHIGISLNLSFSVLVYQYCFDSLKVQYFPFQYSVTTFFTT